MQLRNLLLQTQLIEHQLTLSAGGDVKAARQAVLDSPYSDYPPDSHHISRIFQAEYSTLLLIASYKIPLVSVCQGIWMGLGFGLAGFGRYRVVSDGTVFAVPENAIGEDSLPSFDSPCFGQPRASLSDIVHLFYLLAKACTC